MQTRTFVFLGVLLIGQVAFGQTFGSIGGEVHDSTGAIIAGASVSAINIGTNASRTVATNDAGMWARPHGDEFYRWALKASTTTDMTPDEVHDVGQSELKQLHAEDGPVRAVSSEPCPECSAVPGADHASWCRAMEDDELGDADR